MQTSDQGRAALELEEGVVLRAYRDTVGVWTIGAGLTAASGVVKPVAGMVITREQADALLAKALVRYENQVEVAMAVTEGLLKRPVQHEFDAGVSFHWNLGAIATASWVKLWKAKAAPSAVFEAMCLWSKAGGKVLPSLKARREREFDMLIFGEYRAPAAAAAPHPTYAAWGLKLSKDETRAVFDGLRKLGYDPGMGTDRVALSAALEFQKDHGLTVDGIIGRATLSTLQRALDARAKALAPAAALVAVPTAVASGLADQVTTLPHADAVAVVLAAAWAAQHAWAYRDILATKIAPTLPRVAAYLRSF